MKQLPIVFITRHTDSLGLASGLTAEDLGLTPGPLFRANAGNLALYRFTQTYRGFPVFGPDRLVTFVANNRGVVAMRGAVLDARVAYLHVESQASKALAQSSALTHASQLTNIPTTELRSVDTFLVAVPRTRVIGWATTVMRAQLRIATVVVEADPDLTSLLPLLHFSRGEAEGLADTAQVMVRTEDLDSEITVGDPFTGVGVETADVDALFDGSPLLGSVSDDNTQFRLGTERVVLYDASMAETSHDLEALPVVSADAPVFTASPGTSAFRSQSQFSLFSNSFARVDGLMNGKWESLLPLHGSQSVVPPAEFAPRVIVFTDTPAKVACMGKPACVNELSLLDSPPALIPDEYKQPNDAQPFEVLALAYLRDSHGIALTLHEFGHVVDLFAQPGTIGRDAECTGQADCTESCVEDSTDEAAPLTETFASLMAVWLGHELTAVGRDPKNCSYLPAVSVNSVNERPHNDICRPDEMPFPRLIRGDDPSCPADDLCDKPDAPGFYHDIKNNVFMPTGACSVGGVNGGYRVDSAFQALWELLHEQHCDDTPPFSCQPLTALPLAGSSGDIMGGALLYAARVNSMTYRGFFSDMATYIACNHGEAVYNEFNNVACHHGLRECDAPAPIECEVCGDNERQSSEPCDGGDLGGTTCESLGFVGGALFCDNSCLFDTSMCTTSASTGDDSGSATEPASTEQTPTEQTPTEQALTTNAVGSETDQSSTTAGNIDNEGCGCRNTPTSTNPAWLLPAGLLARRRRATRTLQTAALVGCALIGAGCSREHLFDDSTNATDETTAVTTTGDATSDTAATSEDTGTTASAPAHLYGEFRPAQLTSGMKWEQSPSGNAEHWIWWANIIIEPDHSLHLEHYFCGGPKKVQSFTWEPDGDGIRVVPPDGEGTSFRWSASDVTDVTLRPGEGCGELLLQVQQAGADTPYPAEKYLPGHLCTTAVSQTECEFEFAWCDAPPPECV